MRIRGNHRGMRALGTGFGLACCVIGFLGILGTPDGAGAARGGWAGALLLGAGVAAILASLTVTDPTRIW